MDVFTMLPLGMTLQPSYREGMTTIPTHSDMKAALCEILCLIRSMELCRSLTTTIAGQTLYTLCYCSHMVNRDIVQGYNLCAGIYTLITICLNSLQYL